MKGVREDITVRLAAVLDGGGFRHILVSFAREVRFLRSFWGNPEFSAITKCDFP